MEERASTRWPSCARRNCRRIRSRVVCLGFAAGGERRSASWSIRARVLAGAEAAVERALGVVAERQGAHAGAAGLSGADAAGRRQPGCDSRAGVAAGERVINLINQDKEAIAFCPYVPFSALPH